MLKMASPARPSPGPGTQLVQHRSVRFTNTLVPRFNGDTCWDQHKQVFDAIVKSNGWDNETAALQLLAHLEGDALKVALLVPAPWFLTGWAEGTEVEFMIDTGCQVTILATSVFERVSAIDPLIGSQILPCSRRLVSADSSPLMVWGDLCMTIVFSGLIV